MIWLLGCPGPDDTGEPTASIEVTAEVSPAMGTVVTVTWDPPSTGRVVFDGGETPDGDGTAMIVGVPPETDVGFVVVLEDGTESAPRTVTTGPLSGEVPRLDVVGADANDRFLVVPFVAGGATGPAILDPQGRVVWFHPDTSGLDVYRARLSGGGIVYNAASVSGDPAADSYIGRVSLDGTEVTTIPVPLLAHDFVELSDGTLTAMVVEYRDDVRGDSLVEIAPDGTQTKIWDSWMCFDPEVDVGDETEEGWTFANALDVGPGETSYYLGMRKFSTIVEIDRATGECGWSLGLVGTQNRPDGERFLHQHQFDLTDDSLLVFDNDGADGTVSRVVDYDLASDGTATSRWTWGEDLGLYTFVLGDVHRLPGGDILVDWASAGQFDRVTPDGESVWTVNTPMGYVFGFMDVRETLYE